MTSRRISVSIGLLVLGFALVHAAELPADQSAAERRIANYAAATPTDTIARLQRRIDAGEVTLTFDPQWGYLPSVLAALHIPSSSQSLVYSKTSFQIDKIAPRTPRAIYFGDDIYVGWVQKGGVLEVASVDPALGAVFYTLNQQVAEKPRFERQTHNCLQCHDSMLNTGGVPGFVVQSVYADRYGYPLPASHNPVSSDRSPLRERFGGWYVTGTHGDQLHMGNFVASQPAGEIGNARLYIDRLDLKPTGNITDLSTRINAKAYLAPGSDIVALSLLIHQTSVHNLITQALQAAGTDDAAPAAEALVRGLLLVGEQLLTAPIVGSPQFAADFAKSGPRDSKGRSLRDLDLTRRLLKYPLSYLIYSEGFDALPSSMKALVSKRLSDVLAGREERGEFAISAADRQAITEILNDTKPNFLAR